MKINYRSTIKPCDADSALICQRFNATRVEIVTEDELIYLGFAEDVGETTIHSLLFTIPATDDEFEPEDLYAEFNDQANGMFGEQLGKILLNKDQFILMPTIELAAGRVTYEADAELFDDETDSAEIEIHAIEANHHCDAQLLQQITALLKRFVNYGVAVQINS